MLKFKEWWQSIGGWQFFTTVITLATFFIMLHFTGDTEKAALVAVVLVAVVLVAFTALVAFAIVVLAAAFAAKKDKVSKKTIVLSLIVQFIVILLPMLGIILYW